MNSMVKKLLISGACLRENGFELGEGKYYGEAKLLLLDLNSGRFESVLSLNKGNEHYPKEHPNLQFTAACLDGDVLWLPTDTEIRKYLLPAMELQSVYSHRCFHNIHSVCVVGEQLAVTSTGLDNVVMLDKSTGEINSIVNTQGKEPWHRFDEQTDYRLIHSTRPHDSHPNYVFQLNDELWVTRCRQEDAVNLADVSQSFNISGDDSISVHDGVVWQDKVVFTRVDGLLVVCDQKSKQVIEVIDPFEGNKSRPVGWSRGLHIENGVFYIGYSKLRKTKMRDKLKFLTKGNIKYNSGNNALIVAFDMKARKVLNVFETEEGELDAIYGVLPYNYE